MTFVSQASAGSFAPTRDDVVAAMEEIVKAPVLPGTVERSREGIIVDVPAAQGKQIAEVTHTSSHIPTQSRPSSVRATQH